MGRQQITPACYHSTWFFWESYLTQHSYCSLLVLSTSEKLCTWNRLWVQAQQRPSLPSGACGVWLSWTSGFWKQFLCLSGGINWWWNIDGLLPLKKWGSSAVRVSVLAYSGFPEKEARVGAGGSASAWWGGGVEGQRGGGEELGNACNAFWGHCAVLMCR